MEIPVTNAQTKELMARAGLWVALTALAKLAIDVITKEVAKEGRR